MGIMDSLNLGSVFSGAGSQVASIITYALVSIFSFVIIGIIAFFVYKSIKNKTFYTTPISLTVINENGMEKTRHDLKGGSFFNKGLKDFKIKIPKKWKPFILGYVPEFSKTNSVDGRLHFITSGDQTFWQQYETRWVTKEKRGEGQNEFVYDLIKTPIPRETKQVAVNAIKNWREAVDKNKLTAWGIAIGGFIIMVIAHLISLFIQTRIKCTP